MFLLLYTNPRFLTLRKSAIRLSQDSQAVLSRRKLIMVSNVEQPGSGSSPGPPLNSAKTKAAPKAKPAGAGAGKKEIKILMLHGFTQSGPLFHAKTRALEKLLIKSLAPFNLLPTLIYPTGPNRLLPSDIPGYTPTPPVADSASVSGTSTPSSFSYSAAAEESDNWAWFRRHDATGTYRLLSAGMATIASTIRSAGGPVAGVVGFSQGGAMAAMVASALEPSRTFPPSPSSPSLTSSSGDDKDLDFSSWVADLREANAHQPLRFAAVYSGFFAVPPELSWLYSPRQIQTPTLHFIGSLDTVVEEARSRGLVERCRDPVVVEHPGGHYVPISKEWAMPLVGFVKDRCMGGDDGDD